MLKAIYLLDIKLRFYCFVLRAELEYVCKRNSEELWKKVYARVTDPLRPFRPTLNQMYDITHRKFIKSTIEWIDYFTKLYQQKYEDVDWRITDM